MKRFLCGLVALGLLVGAVAFFMSTRPAFGQARSPAPPDDRAKLEKQTPVTVIPVDHIDSAQAADIVEKMFKSTPGFDVEVLLKLKCVAVRANATAAREAKDLVERLDKAAQARWPFGGTAVRLRLDDTTIAVVCVQWLTAKAKPTRKLIGRQSAHEFVLIGRFADPKYTFDDLLKFANELSDSTTDETTRTALGKYIAILETMARTKQKRANEKNEIKKLIHALRDQREFENIRTDDPNSPAAKLLTLGKQAVPYLINELGNDELTRSVSPEIIANWRVLSPMYVLKIGDCVHGILKEIPGESFGDSWYIHGPSVTISPNEVQGKAQKWWESQKQK